METTGRGNGGPENNSEALVPFTAVPPFLSPFPHSDFRLPPSPFRLPVTNHSDQHYHFKQYEKNESDRIYRINRIFFAFPEERQKGESGKKCHALKS